MNILKTFSWRLACLCLLLYLFACLVTVVTITLTGASALPVNVSIIGTEKKNLVNTDIYRVSINGSTRLLTIKTPVQSNTIQVKDALPNSYFQAIQIKLSNQQASTLVTVAVKIGEETFTFHRQEFFNRWRLMHQSPNLRVYQSPESLSSPRSFLPFWRKVINWGFSRALIWDIFIHQLPLLILILTFLGASTHTGQQLVAQIHPWTIRKGKWPLFVAGGIAILITFYRMPFVVWPLGSGLDPSWIVGLNWAYSKDLHWGQDLVFTYGPYYWLLYPNIVLTQPTLLIAFIVTTSVLAYAIGIFIYYIFYQVQQQKISIVIALIAVLTIALFEYTLLDIAVVSTLLLLVMNKRQSYLASIVPTSFLLALFSLCKFSYLPVSICVIVFYSGQCLIKRKYTEPLLIVLTFLSALYIFWALSGQPVSDLWLFISRAYEIAQGYSEAMATPIWNNAQSVLGNLMTNMSLLGVGIILILGIVVLFFISIRKDNLWFELLLTAPILFLAFKEGFIRMDLPHAVLFFAQVQVILVAYVIFFSVQPVISAYARVILIGLFVVLLVMTSAHIPTIYKPELVSVFNSDTRTKLLTDNKQDLQKDYPIDLNFQKAIGDSSIDIIPYDISLLYGYGFNWNPRLVFQSYSVHSTALDSLNASHFTEAHSPKLLLFSFKSIDNHNPLFDEPALLRKLISRYSVVSSSANSYLLLHRKPKQAMHILPARLQAPGHHSMNTPISIPALPGYYTYLHAHVELTLLGKLLNFLLKIQPLFMDVNLKESNQSQQVRVIRQTAKDGLLVSTFAENFQMASDILSGKAKPNVKSIKFVGNTWIYRSDIMTSFRFEAYP